jgi:cellulose synthase/poly-beta-1,6-N-acetylglucosamine synthase-like glycosyltransferase
MQLFLVIFSILLLSCYSGLLMFYRAGWMNIRIGGNVDPGNHPPAFLSSNRSSPLISVIIPARNEEKNLPVLLDTLMQQTIRAEWFEVIVVDDHSTDQTAALAADYAGKLNLKVISLKDQLSPSFTNSYKKKAIETGIALGKGELIVTTDADCLVPAGWLQSIALFYEREKPQLMVMPVAIDGKKNFIGLFQALDFMSLQGITGAAADKGVHSMCNGANLAYTKSAFREVNGFEGIDAIASGDDMLLMHKIKSRYPAKTRYLKSVDVIVQTVPEATLGAFFSQRIRWASKADKYQDKSMLPVLFLVYFLNLFLFAMPVIALFDNTGIIFHTIRFSLFECWGMLIALKTTVELYFLYPVAKFFQQRPLLWFFPFMQPFHILYTVVAGWLGKFGSYRWKGRKVK